MSTSSDSRMIHPLVQARRDRNLSQAQAAEEVGIGLNTLKRAERGEPLSLETCRLLSKYFAKSTEDLGLTKEESPVRRDTSRSLQREAPAIWIASQMHGLPALPGGLSEKELGAWLVANACHLMPLAEAGLSLESLLDVYPIILKVVQKMPKITRRRLMQLAAAAIVVGDIPILSEKFVSAEGKTELCGTLGESIAASWKLFHTAGNAQVLLVGQALLCLVEQNHSVLPHRDRARFYSSVYNLIGTVLQHQGRGEEALEKHTSAYIAALQAGDPEYVVQSLLCQANAHQALEEHSKAIETLEEALRLIGSTGESHLRSRAHLLGCWADNAMATGAYTIAEEKLAESAIYLDQICPNEEFDRASWLQLAGKYAFLTKDYATATERFDEALAVLPPDWVVRQILVLFPMMATYAHRQEREACFATVNKVVPALHVLNAPSMNETFTTSVCGLLEAFPNDSQVHTFVDSTLHQLPRALPSRSYASIQKE